MSFLHSASGVTILGGTQISAAEGSSVTISQGTSAFKDLSAATAHTAMHDSAARYDAPRCHRNTRARYLDKFELWMLGEGEDFEGKRLIWLNGGAGAGKSAIMQSAVERCTQHGVILGTFFFSRQDASRNYAEILIPTLAYQVACAFPEVMTVLESIIHRNPLIFKASLQTQAHELLVLPLRYIFDNGVIENTSPMRPVFMIDGLDECNDPQKQMLIIRVAVLILCDHHLPVNFVIASRPELAIISAFQKEKQLLPMFTAISLEDDDDAQSDIRRYIEDSFLDILDSHPWREHIEVPWPSPSSIDRLVEKSSGHFIYAATAIKFIASSDEHPPRALEVVEGIETSRTTSPFAELDALYMHILTTARYSKQVVEILGYCYFSYFPNTVASVCHIHDISPKDVLLFMSDVKSLVSLVPNSEADLSITPRHASLRDFLSDKSRSQMLHISRTAHHASLMSRYFGLVDSGPQAPISPSSNWEDLIGLGNGLKDALVHSEDTILLQSLVSRHPPNTILNFWMGTIHAARSLDTTSAEIKQWSTQLLCDYMRAIRDSTALNDDNLYSQHFAVHIGLLLKDLNEIVQKKSQYRIIPALMFSSNPSSLYWAIVLLDEWSRQLHTELHFSSYLSPFLTAYYDPTIDSRSFEAMRRFSQSQSSWSADLATTMAIVLQQLIYFSWPGPSTILHTRASPHRQWLQQRKGLKQMSLGSPKLSSAVSSRIVTVTADEDIRMEDFHSFPFPTQGFLLSCWRRVLYYDRHLEGKIWHEGWRCLILLKVVTHYLRKSDCTIEVVRLARRSLPIAAQWYPKAMKRARAEMDAYVHQWEESPDGLLERVQLLSINDMD